MKKITPYTDFVKHEMAKDPANVARWNDEFNATVAILRSWAGTPKMPLAKAVGISRTATTNSLCPYLNWIRVDALNKADWPYGIADNSIYLDFKLDAAFKQVEIARGGHVYISRADKEQYPQYRYLAMHGIIGIAKENKVKGLRKRGYKGPEDLAAHIAATFNGVMAEVVRYTGGYPYKEGITTIVPAAPKAQ